MKTLQRVSDSWRNSIGSTGIIILLSYCDGHPDLKNSDANRIEFATYYLEHLRFLYKKAEGDNPDVCIFLTNRP